MTSLNLQTLNGKYLSLFQKLHTLSEEELTRPQGEGRWSLLEVAEHLVVSPYTVIGGLRSKEELIERKRKFKHLFWYLVVLFVLRTGISVPVPSEEMKPLKNKNLQTLEDEWQQLYNWLKAFEETASSQELNKAYFRHPVSGPINYHQLLRLGNTHFDSHFKKILPNLSTD